MYCVRCGQSLRENDVYCQSCGLDLRPLINDAKPSEVPVPPLAPLPKEKGRKGWVTLVASVLLLGFVFLSQIIGAVMAQLFSWEFELPVTLFGAIAAVACVLILGGKKLFQPSLQSFVFALKKGWWVVAVSLALMVFEIFEYVSSGEQLFSDGWPLRLLSVLLLCLCVGLSEEGVFRGMLQGGALDAFGKTKRGVIITITVISVLFGAAHVSWFDLDYTKPFDIIQGILKTMQTGTYGFFLSCVVLKTDNLWGPIVLHALDDYLLMVPSICFRGDPATTNYVASGDAALVNIILYAVLILLYLPLVWQGVRILGTMHAPQYGALHRSREQNV